MAIITKTVFADAVNQKLNESLKLAGNIADDCTSAVAEITSAGSEISFPTYNRVAKAGEITKGTALTPAEVSMSDNRAKIKHTGTAIRVFDVDEKMVQGSTLDNMVIQCCDVMAKDLDDAIGAEILAKATKKSPTASKTAITAEEIFDALSLFGDSQDTEDYAGIVVNSRLLPSLYKMPEFTSVDKTYQTNGNGIIKNGLVGYFMGIKMFLSNNNTWDKEKSECVTLICKKHSVGYVKQKDVAVEIEREAKLFANDIVVDTLYATATLDADGIVILRNTVA